MATNGTVSEKSPEAQAYDIAEARRMKSHEYEVNALDYGDHDNSIRHKLAQILCAGRNVKQSEGGDMTAERALMRFAAVTTKAVAVALAHGQMVEDEHNVVLYDNEAAMALLGVSALLDAAPRLIDDFSMAHIDLRSNGESCHEDDEEEEADEEPEVQS